MDNQQSIYDKKYQGDYRSKLTGFEIARWTALEDFITNVVKLSDAKLVLDYGAGVGLHVELWEKVFPQAQLFFCDISDVARKKFTEKYPSYEDNYVPIKDGHALKCSNMFDVVVSVEVLEHVQNLNEYLQDIHLLLKPSGHFIFTTPCANYGSIENTIAILTDQVVPTKEGYRRWKWEEPTHLRRLTSDEATTLLKNAGFDDVTIRFRAHLFSLLCTYLPAKIIPANMRNDLMKMDYELWSEKPNGASMICCARKK